MENINLGNWTAAFINCKDWLIDMPYSKRPAILGSYIASSLIHNLPLAILICKFALIANPNDPILLNNLIYASALNNTLEEEKKFYDQFINIDFVKLRDEDKITVQATMGLILMKTGEINKGKELYKIAIQNCEKIKNNFLKIIAIINYTKQLIEINDDERLIYLPIILNMPKNSGHKDLDYIRKIFIESI